MSLWSGVGCSGASKPSRCQTRGAIDELRTGTGWLVTPDDNVADLAARWAAIATRTEAVARNAQLTDRAKLGGRFSSDPPTLGWILAHLLQEDARHVGHLDVVRRADRRERRRIEQRPAQPTLLTASAADSGKSSNGVQAEPCGRSPARDRALISPTLTQSRIDGEDGRVQSNSESRTQHARAPS